VVSGLSAVIYRLAVSGIYGSDARTFLTDSQKLEFPPDYLFPIPVGFLFPVGFLHP